MILLYSVLILYSKNEKNAVREHIIKIAGFDHTTKGYQAIKSCLRRMNGIFGC